MQVGMSMDGHKSNDPSASRGPSARNEGAIGRSKARTASRVTWGIALLPVVILIVLYPHMLDRVPVHYNAAGIADRYADKFSFDLLLFALLGFVGPLLMKPLGYFVVRSQGAGEDTGGSSLPFYMNVAAALVTLLFTAMSAYSMVRMADLDIFGSVSLTRVIAVLLGAIMILDAISRRHHRSHGLDPACVQPMDRPLTPSCPFGSY